MKMRTATIQRKTAETDISLSLNLDGGGSSAIWWRGRLVTLPAGGRERPLPYAILFGVPSGTPAR